MVATLIFLQPMLRASSETMLRLLIKEVRERAEVYVTREQLKVALKLYVKGSLLMISFYDKC